MTPCQRQKAGCECGLAWIHHAVARCVMVKYLLWSQECLYWNPNCLTSQCTIWASCLPCFSFSVLTYKMVIIRVWAYVGSLLGLNEIIHRKYSHATWNIVMLHIYMGYLSILAKEEMLSIEQSEELVMETVMSAGKSVAKHVERRRRTSLTL